MAGAAAAAFAASIKSSVAYETHILRLAQSAGTTTEAMSGLAYASKMMGGNVDDVAGALERFDRNLLLIRTGHSVGAMKEVFGAIDISKIKNSDDALRLWADRWAKMPYGPEKTAEAVSAFGRAGATVMIPLLAKGSKGMEDFISEAQAMGLVVTQEQTEAAEKFEQNVTRMEESLHGLEMQIANKTIPALNDLMGHFQDTQKKEGTGHGVLEFWSKLTEAMTLRNPAAFGAYVLAGKQIVEEQEKAAPAVKKVAQSLGDENHAADALRKSIASLTENLTIQTKALEYGAGAGKDFELSMKAAALGMGASERAAIAHVRALQTLENVYKRIEEVNKPQTSDQKNQALLERKLATTQMLAAAWEKQINVMMTADKQFGPDTLGPKLDATPSKAFTDQADQLVASLEKQIDTFGMSADAITRYNLALEDGSPAAQQKIAQIEQLQEQLAKMKTAQEKSAAAWKQMGETINRSLDDLIFSGKKFHAVLMDIVKLLGETLLRDLLFGVGKGSFLGSGSMFGTMGGGGGGGMFGGLFSGLGNLLFGSGTSPSSAVSSGGLFGSLTNWFSGLFGGGGGGGGGAIADLSGFATSGFFPMFASGGSTPGNSPIIVGENGPELFMPGTSGTIVPNGALRSASAGPSVVYNIDARGSSITQEQFRQSLAASENRAVQRSLNAGRESQLRS